MGAAMQKWGEWIRFSLTMGAIAALAIFDNRYVTRSAYAEDQRGIEAVKVSLETVRTSIALLEQQSRTIGDHEARLRALERRPDKKVTQRAESYAEVLAAWDVGFRVSCEFPEF